MNRKPRIALDPEQTAYWNDAAGLIREHFWRDMHGKPLKAKDMPSPDGYEWTMARECSIWKILVVKGGHDPEAVNGAIEVLRTMRPDITGPLRLTAFYHHGTDNAPGGSANMNLAIGYWRKREANAQRDNKRNRMQTFNIQITR